MRRSETKRKFDEIVAFADISKIRERLGFEPMVRFEDGLGELVGVDRNANGGRPI